MTAFAFGASFGAGGAWEHLPVWVWPWCAPDQRDAVAFPPGTSTTVLALDFLAD